MSCQINSTVHRNKETVVIDVVSFKQAQKDTIKKVPVKLTLHSKALGHVQVQRALNIRIKVEGKVEHKSIVNW